MTPSEKKQLSIMACKVRKGIVEATHSAKSGHPGGSLSATELFTYLYFKELNVDPANPKWEDRDRFVLSKGHTAPGLYSALAQRGFIPVEDLKTLRKKKLRDGDVTLLFILMYGACQIILDSTRYDSLFMRSNGFVSIVQILGLVAVVISIVLYSIRLIKARGFKWYFILFWVLQLAMMGGAGYMEYYVQRHGDQAAFAYSVMAPCLLGIVLITLVIRAMAVSAERKNEI